MIIKGQKLNITDNPVLTRRLFRPQGDNELVSYLKSLGVDLELQDRDGDTALDLAELQYHTDTSNILREK